MSGTSDGKCEQLWREQHPAACVHLSAITLDKQPEQATKRVGGLGKGQRDANGEIGHQQVEEMKGG